MAEVWVKHCELHISYSVPLTSSYNRTFRHLNRFLVSIKKTVILVINLKSLDFLHRRSSEVCVCGGQNCLLPTMDMAKVGGPLSAVKVWTSMQSIGKWVAPYRLWMFSHKFKHPMSTPRCFSLPLILSATHISPYICNYLCKCDIWSLQWFGGYSRSGMPLIHLMHLDAERTWSMHSRALAVEISLDYLHRETACFMLANSHPSDIARKVDNFQASKQTFQHVKHICGSILAPKSMKLWIFSLY